MPQQQGSRGDTGRQGFRVCVSGKEATASLVGKEVLGAGAGVGHCTRGALGEVC